MDEVPTDVRSSYPNSQCKNGTCISDLKTLQSPISATRVTLYVRSDKENSNVIKYFKSNDCKSNKRYNIDSVP